MEDTIQIIIFILFFIFSIISSKNKNKKKKQQKIKRQVNQPSGKIYKQQTQQNKQQDIFEELFGLKPKPQVPPTGVVTDVNKQKESGYKTWYAEDDFKPKRHNDNYSFKEKDEELKQEFAEEEIEHDVFRIKRKSNFKEDIKKTKEKLEKEKLEYEALKGNKQNLTRNIVKNKYQKLFQNPSTLKDYIIVSEILNKPKALRR